MFFLCTAKPSLPQRPSGNLDILSSDADRVIAAQKRGECRDFIRLDDALLGILLRDLRHCGGKGTALAFPRDDLFEAAMHVLGFAPCRTDDPCNVSLAS